MFPHSKIANIPTNRKAVALKPPMLLTGSVPKHLNDDLKKESTQPSGMDWLQMEAVMRMVIFCKIFVRHIEKVSRLIETSLLDMRNINSMSTAQQMYDACNEVVKDNFSLSWDNCVSNSFDNTNSMVEAHESLLKKMKDSQGNQKVFHGEVI